ncbi:hypothetical protein [Microbacterium sp. NPDC055357]
MSTTTEFNRRTRAQAWRDSIAGYLSAELRSPIRPRISARRPSETFANVTGDVLGVPGVTVLASAEHRMRLSEDLDVAGRRAADAGDQIGAVVQRRHGRPTAESYVLMTLDHFGKLLRRDVPGVG